MILSLIKKSVYKKYGILFLIILVFTPTFYVYAQNPIDVFIADKLIGGTLNFVQGLMGSLIALLGTWITPLLNVGVSGVAVVNTGWNMIRNFTNMFFIIALIIMAFATIFSISRYDFRTLIARFLIAALLINFSLVIGEIIIDWSQSLSNVFLLAIGDVGARIAQGASLGGRFEVDLSTQNVPVDIRAWQGMIAVFANIILLSIILFSMLVLVFFSIIRIPILWALLIVSPVAWVTYILPTTSSISRQWWKYFIGWNIFMPIYLFFIYFGILFLTEQERILGTPTSDSIIPGLGISGSFQVIFFYILTGMFLIGGAKVAMSSSMSAGAGGVAASIWAKGRATARWTGTAPFRGGKYLAGVGWRASGAEGVYSEAKDRFKREGFAGFEATEKSLGKLYRGQRGRDEAAVWLGGKIKGATGLDLVPGLAEKQLAKNIDTERNKLKEMHVGETGLRTEIATATDPARKIAAMQRLQEEFNKAPESGQVLDIVESLGTSARTELGAKILKQIKWSDMTADDLNVLLADPVMSDPNIQTLIYNALIEKRRIKPDQFNTAVSRTTVSSAQKANMISKARELIGEDMSSGERARLHEILMGTQKDPMTGAFVHSLADQARIQNENKDAIREILKIRAQKKDSFFNNAAGDPDQATLNNYAATYFETPSERKKFLEDVSKKHAYSAAMTILDQNLAKDDTGQTITRIGYIDPITRSVMTPDQVEKLVTKQTFQRLNLEEKLTQNKAQLASPILSKIASEEMSRNSSSMQSWISHDKYQTFNVNSGGKIEKESRSIIFHREFFGPFMDQARKLKDEISKLQAGQRTIPPALTPAELNTTRKGLQDNNLARLRNLRGEYERMCTRYDMVDSTVTTQFNRLDSIINGFRDKITKLK